MENKLTYFPGNEIEDFVKDKFITLLFYFKC